MNKTVQELVSNVQLQSVRLMRADTKTRVRDITRLPAADLNLQRAVKILGRYDDGFLLGAVLQARIIVSEPEPDDPSPNDPIAEFHLLYELHYLVDDAAQYGDEILLEFGKVNGTFNVWPYWREYIHTTSARMSLPPVVLPVFRIGPPPKPKESSPQTAPVKESAAALPQGRKKQSRKKR